VKPRKVLGEMRIPKVRSIKGRGIRRKKENKRRTRAMKTMPGKKMHRKRRNQFHVGFVPRNIMQIIVH